MSPVHRLLISLILLAISDIGLVKSNDMVVQSHTSGFVPTIGLLHPIRSIPVSPLYPLQRNLQPHAHFSSNSRCQPSPPTGNNICNSMRNPETFVSSKGTYTAQFMPYWPSISTCTLVSGWNDELTTRFINAVEDAIRKNPVLSGKAIKTDFPENPFVNVVNTLMIDKSFPSPDNLSNIDLLQYLDVYVSPFSRKLGSVDHLISSSCPLFGVDLIILPDGFACYVMKMAHCIGDGVTYYNIMNEVNYFFNGHHRNMQNATEDIHNGVDWYSPLISSHEIFPEIFSPCDIHKSYGLPFFAGLVHNILLSPRNQKRYLLLSKKNVDHLRNELGRLHEMHLSPNDVITAALCEANSSTDVFAFTMDTRDRRHKKLGGNYHREIPFDRIVGSDPHNFRQILKNGFYYKKDKLPFLAFVQGRVGRISSLATIQKLVTGEGLIVHCHSMLSFFLENLPLDAAFISDMNNDTFVVLHNFREISIREGSLLEKILVS